VVLDKTGTITRGEPRVTDVIPAGPGWAPEEVIGLAAAVEVNSEHPLAQAIVSRARELGLDPAKTGGFRTISGRGVRATVEPGLDVLLGNPAFLESKAVETSPVQGDYEKLIEQGKTAVLAAVDGEVAGVIALADTVKEHARDAIAELQRMGIEVVMLTGDNRGTAAAIAREVGISRVVAEVLPEHKAEEVSALKGLGKVVAMVGDGINDAPALATADLGIAIGTGTDVAMETAGVTLMSGDLRGIPAAIRLSKRTMAKIRQNLFWAFIYNTVGIPVAALGYLNPVIAGAAMAMSSVSVVTNSLLLKRFDPRRA